MSLENLRLEKRTIIAGAIFSLAFFLLALDSFVTYKSEILILVEAKTPLAANQQRQIFNNILEFPKMLSFYDRMLSQNPDVRDVWVGLTDKKRKAAWNEKISVLKVNENASIFKISVESRLKSDSEQLATKTVRTLFDTTAFYYDIKSDFDLRIIDGAVSGVNISHWFELIISSIMCGFGIAILVIPIFSIKNEPLNEKNGTNLFFDLGKKTKKSVGQGIESLRKLYQSDMPFAFPKTENDNIETPQTNLRIQEMKKLTRKIELTKYPNFPEMPVTEKIKASAPDNLPIADEDFSNQFQAPAKEDIFSEEILQAPALTAEQEQKEDTKREPTPEDLKKKLNQLLRGEF